MHQATSKVKWDRFNKRIVNDLRVTDHHGLLITEKIPSALTAKKNIIYNMIACRLLEAISQACTKEVTDITLQALHYDFTVQELPELKEDDGLKIKNSEVLEKKTNPPVLYTETGLAAVTYGKCRERNRKRG